MIKQNIFLFTSLLFAFSVVGQEVTIVKERLLVDKKQNPLVHSDGKSSGVKVRLISKGPKVAAKKKKIIVTKKYKKGKKTYTNKKVMSKKRYAKKKILPKKKVAKKAKVRRKTSKKKYSKKKNMKTTISNMKTCAVYNPPGRKHASVVVEATSDKNRKIAKNKRCKTYRKTKKNGKSMLVIEIEENQI